MKKSIILLATLFFVILMTSLIGVNTNLLKRGFDLSNSTKFMVQVNSLLKDIITILNSKTSLVKDETTMLILTNSRWSIQEKKISLNVNIDIQSNAKTFNINRLKKDANSTANNSIYGIIETILKAYNVADYEYFLSILIDSIDKDLEELAYESEIALIDPSFEQGLILSMFHFKKIISFYKHKVADYNIDNIPWEHIIGFSGEDIDINYISPILLSYILPLEQQELESLLSEHKPINSLDAIFSPGNKIILSNLGIKTFVPSIKCFVDIDVFGRSAKAVFSYNLISKRAQDVSISTKY